MSLGLRVGAALSTCRRRTEGYGCGRCVRVQRWPVGTWLLGPIVLRSRGGLSLAPEHGLGNGLDSRTPGRGQHRHGVQSKRRPPDESAIVSSQRNALAPGAGEGFELVLPVLDSGCLDSCSLTGS